ncbi:hypothetical protein BC834DRAFT_643741 [Gloeopeniophorella convolvens]|nr:hypothetical protein BC834DRAFT_643741 [Gloeopeniophorella convolvens]
MSFLPRRTAPSAEAAMSQTAAAPPLQSQDAPEMRREGPAETHIRGSQSIHQPTLPPSTRVHTRPSQRAPSLRRVPRITDSDIDTLLRESTAVTRNQVPPASVSPSPLTTRRYPADPIDEQDRPRPVPQATGDIETAWYARGDRPTSSSPHVRSPQRAPSLRRAPRVADPDSTPLRENTAGIHDHASPAVVLPHQTSRAPGLYPRLTTKIGRVLYHNQQATAMLHGALAMMDLPSPYPMLTQCSAHLQYPEYRPSLAPTPHHTAKAYRMTTDYRIQLSSIPRHSPYQYKQPLARPGGVLTRVGLPGGLTFAHRRPSLQVPS